MLKKRRFNCNLRCKGETQKQKKTNKNNEKLDPPSQPFVDLQNIL